MTQRQLFALQLLLGVITLLSCIGSRYQTELYLQHVLTLAGFVIWQLVHARWALSARSHLLISVFILLHVFGARWVYSNVPYDLWLQALLGGDTQSWFGWQRNHYDRLVHLAYGLCLTLPWYEVLRRRGHAPAAAWQLAVLWIVVSSVIYEWFEWGVAITLDPQAAEHYNGQQGDLWDAHKDMLLASVGAMISWLAWRKQVSAQD